MTSKNPDASGDAALYVLGLMTPQEREAFAQRIGADEQARFNVVEFESLLLNVGRARAIERAPIGIKDRLLAELPERAPATPRFEISPGLSVVLSSRIEWRETGIPGVRVRTLHADPVRRYASNLVAMDQGAVYPSHRHSAVEELFMMAGEVSISGHRLRIGDYCRAEIGTVHDDVIAETDCLFVALASLNDEFVTPAD